ncbi:methylenetetrahydrofolate reductase C-terminal domain-containing protein [Desulfatiferula olefinivorans]
MIVGEQKPIKEIKAMVAGYQKLLILGCGTCVKTCFAGGEDETAALASALRLSFRQDGLDIRIAEKTVERQCENEFIREAASAVAENDAVLSLACGAGVQALARRFGAVPVYPGLDTTFLGVQERQGVFTEECSGCGHCELGIFGGICPVTRCSKKLLNGPCGGSQRGVCEINPDLPCAWQLIIDRLGVLGQMNNLRTYIPPKNWKTSLSGGPRNVVREDHIL